MFADGAMSLDIRPDHQVDLDLGLLRFALTTDQLAAAIAHELGHSLAKHRTDAVHSRTEEREAPNTPVQSLPPVYGEAIGDAQAGTLVGPFPLGAPGMPTKYILLNVTERRQPQDIRFEDVRDQIRSRLGEELALRKYLDRLRRATFVELREAPGG